MGCASSSNPEPTTPTRAKINTAAPPAETKEASRAPSAALTTEAVGSAASQIIDPPSSSASTETSPGVSIVDVFTPVCLEEEEDLKPVMEDVPPPPAVEDVLPPPVVGDVLPPPVVEDGLPPPVVEDVLPPPVVEDVLTPPVVEDVLPPPVVEDVLPPPVVEDVLPPPVVEDVLPPPVEDVPPPPVVEDVLPPPVVEDVLPPPVVEESVAIEKPSGDLLGKKGFIARQCKDYGKGWKSRYFVLETGILSFYEQESMESKEGEISLDGATLLSKENKITLQSPTHQDMLMDIRLLTERKLWIQAVQDHISHYYPTK